MEQKQSTISSRYQTVIPAYIRQKLNLTAGKKLIWRLIYVSGNPKIIAEPEPKSWAKYTRGLGKKIWQNINIEEYIKNLRQEWQK